MDLCAPPEPDPGTGVAVHEKPGRNSSCHCGSGKKYKRCCLPEDETIERAAASLGLPGWVIHSRGKLRQFLKYVCHVFDLRHLLGRFSDSRRKPEIPTFDVVNSLLHTAALRIPSINALEGDLKEEDFQKLIGRKPRQDVKVFSAEVVSNVLDQLDLDSARSVLRDVFWKAERNKAFRDQTYGALRCVAVDGWEPFSSYHRHCPDCLERQVETKDGVVTQYYHRYVVAFLVGPLLDVVLDIEPLRNRAARIRAGETEADTAEGELSALPRLIDRLKKNYGTFMDAILFDSLYPNGPVLTKLSQCGYGALVVLKKDENEPLKEALAQWHCQPPCLVIDDSERKEHIEFWDAQGLATLDTYKGNIRVIRAVVTKANEKTRTWCVAVVGKKAQRLSLPTALKTMRARWHIENTAFNQWVKYWNLSHVFRHTANAVMAVLLLWSIAFNLLQFFVYRRLRRPRRPADPTYTIRHIVEMMNRDLGTLPAPFPWLVQLDTS